MRLLLFLTLIFLVPEVRAQINTGNGSDLACDETTISGGDFDYDCQTLTINNPPTFVGAPSVVVIRVQGAVTISANIVLDGTAGTGSVAGVATGGAGGPGGSQGGDLTAGPPTPNPGGNAFATSSDGLPGQVGGGACGGGGAGGGFALTGDPGTACGGANGGNGGVAAIGGVNFDFTDFLFRGGFGGGSGAPGAGAASDAGTGGGGGGGLRISAGGNVTIAQGVTISAIGGRGGDAPVTNTGGGGGGGSGGSLWIQTNGTITNLGTIDLRGGAGGNNSLAALSGGAGSDGPYRLEDSVQTITGTGLRNAVIPAPPAAAGAGVNYTSDISCGTIAVKHEKENFLQMMAAFALVSLIGFLLRKKLSAQARGH